MITYAFAGQGSQRTGMGAAVFPRYRDKVRMADEVLEYSVADVCLSGDRRLGQTEYAQPALFVVNALIYENVLDRFGLPPSYLLGHSVGELNALHAAGVFDFETGLHIVKKRGELMAECGTDGVMAALLGEREPLITFLDGYDSDVYLASDNSPRQIVVAADRRAIPGLASRIEERGLGELIPLAVSGAFHSPFMREARDRFGEFLSDHMFYAPRIPVVANVSASPYRLDEVRNYMADHLVRPVRWVQSVHYLLERGPMVFHEIGEGRVVAPLIQQIIRSRS